MRNSRQLWVAAQVVHGIFVHDSRPFGRDHVDVRLEVPTREEQAANAVELLLDVSRAADGRNYAMRALIELDLEMAIESLAEAIERRDDEDTRFELAEKAMLRLHKTIKREP